MDTKIIEKGLKDAILALKPCWVDQVACTTPAYKLCSIEKYLRSQLNDLYAEAFSDPEAEHA